MSGTCGHYEPFYNPWNVFFSCVIDQYFISFLFEHPVLLLVVAYDPNNSLPSYFDNALTFLFPKIPFSPLDCSLGEVFVMLNDTALTDTEDVDIPKHKHHKAFWQTLLFKGGY